MRYFGGCDVGSTYTKAVIIDETGKILSNTTVRSKINSEQSARMAMDDVLEKAELSDSKQLDYLVGTGYGRNKVPFADENISEISCHAMGVHVSNPAVKAIIDIGGQDVKGISIDTDGTVKNFAMNDKCAAGTGSAFIVHDKVNHIALIVKSDNLAVLAPDIKHRANPRVQAVSTPCMAGNLRNRPVGKISRHPSVAGCNNRPHGIAGNTVPFKHHTERQTRGFARAPARGDNNAFRDLTVVQDALCCYRSDINACRVHSLTFKLLKSE